MRRLPLSTREAMWFYLLIAPWVVGLLLFQITPLAMSFYFSFTQYDIVSPPKWIGTSNYSRIFRDELFWKSLRITAIYTFFSVFFEVVFSFFLALLLNTRVFGVGVFRTLVYLPTVISGVALASIWFWMFNPSFGLINYLLWQFAGINGPLWFQSEQWVLVALVVISIWGIGSTTIIYLAALQGISTELYESAVLDGANGSQCMLLITLPMMSPVVFFTIIIGIINSFQSFTTAQVLTKGGPNYSSLFYVLYIYQVAFRDFRIGYASALSWILFCVTLLMTVVSLRWSSRWVYYESLQE